MFSFYFSKILKENIFFRTSLCHCLFSVSWHPLQKHFAIVNFQVFSEITLCVLCVNNSIFIIQCVSLKIRKIIGPVINYFKSLGQSFFGKLNYFCLWIFFCFLVIETQIRPQGFGRFGGCGHNFKHKIGSQQKEK